MAVKNTLMARVKVDAPGVIDKQALLTYIATASSEGAGVVKLDDSQFVTVNGVTRLNESALHSIRYDLAQNLTDEQKAQARHNIGAGDADFSGSYNDIEDKPTLNTDYAAPLSPSPSETIDGVIALHRVSKTGKAEHVVTDSDHKFVTNKQITAWNDYGTQIDIIKQQLGSGGIGTGGGGVLIVDALPLYGDDRVIYRVGNKLYITDNTAAAPTDYIIIDQSSLQLQKGQSRTLTYSASGEVSWSSSVPAVATVDNTGKVTAIEVGDTVITGQVGAVKATCGINVIEAAVEPDPVEPVDELLGAWKFHTSVTTMPQPGFNFNFTSNNTDYTRIERSKEGFQYIGSGFTTEEIYNSTTGWDTKYQEIDITDATPLGDDRDTFKTWLTGNADKVGTSIDPVDGYTVVVKGNIVIDQRYTDIAAYFKFNNTNVSNTDYDGYVTPEGVLYNKTGAIVTEIRQNNIKTISVYREYHEYATDETAWRTALVYRELGVASAPGNTVNFESEASVVTFDVDAVGKDLSVTVFAIHRS